NSFPLLVIESRKWIRQELRSQPGELVEGEFVHPSALSWGTLTLIMKEEDDGMRLCVNSSNWVRSQSEETIRYFKLINLWDQL
ncbi:hypothetical protein PIB30_105726, partial [Stylosanthes scabra]|nr:hypothetical protein [Stylosanthes scabra]